LARPNERDVVKTLSAFLAIGLGWLAYSHFNAPLTYPPGVLVIAEPVQAELPANSSAIAHGSFQLKPLAKFSLDARVLHRKNYRYDHQSKLAPIDLAVGWGKMSDQAVLDRLTISQSSRFYWYEYQLPPPIPQDEIIRQSTNLHLIPMDAVVEKACRNLRGGELIHLEGQLVEASGPEIGTWRSSLSRSDSGNGACELVLVEDVRRLEP
jgi:hypothetical protein